MLLMRCEWDGEVAGLTDLKKHVASESNFFPATPPAFSHSKLSFQSCVGHLGSG